MFFKGDQWHGGPSRRESVLSGTFGPYDCVCARRDVVNGDTHQLCLPPEGLGSLLSQRGATPLTWKHWQTIDAEERRRGVESARPRVKLVDFAEMLAAAQ